MITFKYIPNLLSQEGRKQIELAYEPDRILLSYLGETQFLYNDCSVVINGTRAKEYDIYLKDGDEVLIIVQPKWIAVGAWWIFSEWAMSLIATISFWAGVLMTVYSIVSAITARRPNFGSSGSGLDESSPTYGWEGITTTQDVGIPIGIVYGEHRVGGNIINQYIRTDGDKQYLNLLIALGEGEIESIDDIEINENPSDNFDNVTLTKKYGTNSQTLISNFQDTHNLQSLNVALLKDDPYVHTTVETDITAFELKLTLVGGLYQAGGSGNLQSWAVIYKVEYKIHTDPVYTDLGSTTIDAMSRTDVRRVFRKEGLTAGQYDIRITRTSDDSSLDPLKQGDLYLKGVDEIVIDDPLIYPNVALLGVEALATDQLSGATPNITSLVKGRKISTPDVREEEGGSAVLWEDYYYDAGSSVYRGFSDDRELYWDGSTFINAFGANPIWCMRDLLTNTRYGLGDYINTNILDLDALIEMAQYCEEKVSDGEGGYEKRFRMDVVIDSETKALDLIMQLCATFRAFPFYSNGTVMLKIDKADTPVQMFGMGNIVKSSFMQNWKSIKEYPNVVEIQFMDKDKNYKQELIAVMDEVSLGAGNPMRKSQLRLFCTRLSQCLREGKYALNIGKHINRTVTLKASIDAIACQAGDLINVCHDVPQWGFSGRVQANSTTTKVYLGESVTLENGKTYFIRVRFANDTQEERQITTGAGTHSFVEVGSAFSNAPAVYDLYAIGEVNKLVKPFRIVSMKRAGNSEVEITAIEYNVNVYDTDTIYIPDNNYSALTFEIPDVENLALTERLVKLGDGTIENVIDVWFNKPTTSTRVIAYDRAKIYLSDNDGDSWLLMGETTGSHFAIQNNLADLQEYKVAVVSVGFNGKVNAIANSPTSTITLIGKSAPPSDVSSFLVNQSRDRLYFGWTQITDVDLAGYEIRYGASWESGYILGSRLLGNNFILLNFKEGNAQSYWIKAIDTSGNYSTTATEAVVTIDNIPFTNIVLETNEHPDWTGTKVDCSKVGDNLELDEGELTGTYTTDEVDVGYVATFKIGIHSIATVSGDDTWQDFGEDTFQDIPETLRFSGSEVLGATSFEIRTSEDDITWSDWETWQAGDYKCRYYQLRMTVTRTSTSQDLEVSEFTHYADLPDVDEFGEDEVTVAGDGKAVTFSKTFHETPSVNIDIRSGDGYVHKFSVVPDTSGFTVKLYDLSGVAKTGEFSYHAHGI
jgi:predicted phage tail protein